MSPYTYFSNYFSGLLLAFLIQNGFKLNLPSKRRHFFWLGLAGVIANAAELGPGLFNTLDILGQDSVPLYLIVNRASFTLSIAIFILYVSSLKKQDKSVKTVKEKVAKTEETSNHTEFSWKLYKEFVVQTLTSPLAKALTRLSFSIYLANYYFIRSDFFTSRVVFTNDWYSLTKRIITYFICITLASLLFHVSFVMPFDSLRKMLNVKIKKESASKDECKEG